MNSVFWKRNRALCRHKAAFSTRQLFYTTTAICSRLKDACTDAEARLRKIIHPHYSAGCCCWPRPCPQLRGSGGARSQRTILQTVRVSRQQSKATAPGGHRLRAPQRTQPVPGGSGPTPSLAARGVKHRPGDQRAPHREDSAPKPTLQHTRAAPADQCRRSAQSEPSGAHAVRLLPSELRFTAGAGALRSAV